MDQAQDQHGLGAVSLDTRKANVQEVVRQAHEELRLLMHKRAEVVKRISTLKQTIAGLASLFGDKALSNELLDLVGRKNHRQSGFTKTCRTILMESAVALSARSIRDQIQQRMPLMLAHHKDPLASVTTVLNRLVEYGEVRVVTLENGLRAWQWVRIDAGDFKQMKSVAMNIPEPKPKLQREQQPMPRKK